MYIKRHIEIVIKNTIKEYPVLLVSGPRQVGKYTVLKTMFPECAYETLGDFNIVQAISSDALGYLQIKGTPFFINEIQKTPNIFSSIKQIVDKDRRNGQYFLSSPQKFEHMKGVNESLAGRISIINLLGLSYREINDDSFNKPFLPNSLYLKSRNQTKKVNIDEIFEIIHRGSMPALYESKTKDWERYYADYVSSYIERDVRALTQVGDTITFMQFLTTLASRTGELLNMGSIAKEIGVSAPTIKRWVSILEASNIIYLLYPYSMNIHKRVVKTPKVYFTDTGLVCYLCRWLTKDTLINGAQAGSIFETYVVDEIIKSYINAGKKPNIYFFRNTDGQEVDLLIVENGRIYPIEIKKTSSPNEGDIRNFKTLSTYFPTMTIDEGGIVCLANSLLPLGNKNKIIPVNLI